MTKRWADSFHETELSSVLESLGATELLVAGMMTQNCVTHTAISRSAEEYTVKVLLTAARRSTSYCIRSHSTASLRVSRCSRAQKRSRSTVGRA